MISQLWFLFAGVTAAAPQEQLTNFRLPTYKDCWDESSLVQNFSRLVNCGPCSQVWRLPLFKGYAKKLSSKVADMNNVRLPTPKIPRALSTLNSGSRHACEREPQLTNLERLCTWTRHLDMLCTRAKAVTATPQGVVQEALVQGG